jgi:hypothetical protein
MALWQIIQTRWEPDSPVWQGLDSIPIETARNEILDLCDAVTAATQRAEAAEQRLLALQVDAGALVRLRDDTDNVLWSLKPEDIPGAINWGDLGTRETQEVIDESRRWYRVIIEEADPANPALHTAVLAGLAALGWDTNDLEIETAW